VAALLGAPSVTVPPGAGVTSAVGFLTAPLSFDFVQGWYGRMADLEWPRVNAFLEDMEQRGRGMLAAAGLRHAAIDVLRSCDLRYEGQGSEVGVPVPAGPLGADRVEEIRQDFERRYQDLYGRTVPGTGLEVVNWRVSVRGPRPTLRIAAAETAAGSPEQAQKGARPAYFGEAEGFVETPVFDRYRLGPGAVIAGPAIIEERESTIVVGPGSRARIDELLSVVVELARAPADRLAISETGRGR
jgi:N-methylhydantoinase A